MRYWMALLSDVRFPGGIAGIGSNGVARGTVTLRMRLSNAGAHSNRSVDVTILPGQLEAVARMIANAIEIRDAGR